jgi:hypothetical protein
VVARTLGLDFGLGERKPGSSKPHERFVMAIVVSSSDDGSVEQTLEKSGRALLISDNQCDVAQLVEYGGHFSSFLELNR